MTIDMLPSAGGEHVPLRLPGGPGRIAGCSSGLSPRCSIGRQEELSQLEDALLSANRGDGRFILLAGEAGIGKTRLAAELTRRARKLGFDVLRGSCSESELALPYLPFVEAVGNRLDEADAAALRVELGPTAGELAQLFPQLADGAPRTPAGDPAQAKQRLFESFVTLLDLWARDRGLVLVLDDIHWADSSTRELLDYVARRLVRSRVMLLAIHRSDELDRRHPLTRVVQIWRRAGLAETVTVTPMTPRYVAEMVGAILNAEQVGADLVTLVDAHAEGNPFVLEEMLREALDRGEIFQTEAGWRRRSNDVLRMPETVREAVLLRLGRLEPEQIEVLRAAAVLGRTFDYGLLVHVAEADEAVVLAALESAVAQQLLEEAAGASDQYRWRHALTQEAIASDTVVPKRQRIHSRAADALAAAGGGAMALARHLLEAGRMDEAVDACLRAAREAERAVAFTEAAELLERILPHVFDPRERALLHARMGKLRWLSGEPAAAEQLLAEGVRQLDDLGLALDAARARLHLGRCRWELDQPDAAFRDFERARDVLEQEGPSSDLALAYLRISGIHAFQLDYRRCRAAAERAAVIAEQASADFERVWALSHAAIGLFGTAREFEQLDRCYQEAVDRGYAIIAGNILYNEIWDRVQTLAGGLEAALQKLERVPDQLSMSSGGLIARSLVLLARGEPRDALENARKATARHESLGASKFAWRSRLAAAEALLELGRPAEAAAELPPPSPGNELQDIVYDTPARVGVALELGHLDEAVALGRRVASADPVLVFRATVAVAVDALVRGGRLAEAEALLSRARGAPGDLGGTGLELAEGRILLASGAAAAAQAASRAGGARLRGEGPAAVGVARGRAPRRGSRSIGRRRGRERALRRVHPHRAPGRRGQGAGRRPGNGRPARRRRPAARRRSRRRHRRARPASGRRALRHVRVRGRSRVHAVRRGELARRARRPPDDAAPLGRDRGGAAARDRGQVRRRRRDGDVQRHRRTRRPCRSGARGRTRAPGQGGAHGSPGRDRDRGRPRRRHAIRR